MYVCVYLFGYFGLLPLKHCSNSRTDMNMNVSPTPKKKEKKRHVASPPPFSSKKKGRMCYLWQNAPSPPFATESNILCDLWITDNISTHPFFSPPLLFVEHMHKQFSRSSELSCASHFKSCQIFTHFCFGLPPSARLEICLVSPVKCGCSIIYI